LNLKVGYVIKRLTDTKTIHINHLAYIKQKICNNCFEKKLNKIIQNKRASQSLLKTKVK
jgi:hypothetical protein